MQHKWERGKCGTNLTWVLNPDGLLYIGGKGSMGDIYEKRTGYVTQEEADATMDYWGYCAIEEGPYSYEVLPWEDGRKIRKVIIGPGVTSIGSRVFSKSGNYKNLKGIVLSDTVTKLDFDAVVNCPNLETIVIPASVTSFFAGMFEGCPKLTIYTPENSYAMKYAKKRKICVKNINCLPKTEEVKCNICPTCGEYRPAEEIIHFGGGCSLCSIEPRNQYSFGVSKENFYGLFFFKDNKSGRIQYHFGLDLSNGTAWRLLVPYQEKEGKYFGKQITYDELREHSKNDNFANLRDLTHDNWYEYTLTKKIIFYFDRVGEGPYHEETRYGLFVCEDGYRVVCGTVSPMVGDYMRSWELPIGFFVNKTRAEIWEYFNEHRGDTPELRGFEGAFRQLIRTDKYKLEKQKITAKYSENL